MVNLVKAIESLIDVKIDQKILKSLKKQLKINSLHINKLRQSTLIPSQMLAPIHAAILYGNFQILQLILATEGVDINTKAVVKSRNTVMKLGVIDVAVCLVENINLEVVKFLLERHQSPELHYADKPIPGTPLSISLMFSVEGEHLDTLDVLHRKAEVVESFSPFYSLLVSIVLNKVRVFSHVLPQAEAVRDLGRCFYDDKEGRNFTLLEFAELYKRTEICDILRQAVKVCDKNDIDESEKKTKENKSVEIKICWNCLSSDEDVFLYRCAGCRRARYCEDECQEDDWERHQKYCKSKMNRRAFKEFGSLDSSVFA